MGLVVLVLVLSTLTEAESTGIFPVASAQLFLGVANAAIISASLRNSTLENNVEGQLFHTFKLFETS